MTCSVLIQMSVKIQDMLKIANV